MLLQLSCGLTSAESKAVAWAGPSKHLIIFVQQLGACLQVSSSADMHRPCGCTGTDLAFPFSQFAPTRGTESNRCDWNFKIRLSWVMLILWNRAFPNYRIHGKLAIRITNIHVPNLSDMLVNRLHKGHRHVVTSALQFAIFINILSVWRIEGMNVFIVEVKLLVSTC